MQFNELLEVKALELDIYIGEQNETLDTLPFRFKFMIRSIQSEHYFFAANHIEREIWLRSFAKVLEYNTCGPDKFNLRSAVDVDTLIKRDIMQAWGSVKKVQNSKVDGTEIYKSPDLLVNKYTI